MYFRENINLKKEVGSQECHGDSSEFGCWLLSVEDTLCHRGCRVLSGAWLVEKSALGGVLRRTSQQATTHPACGHGEPCLTLEQSKHQESRRGKKKGAMEAREHKGQGKVIKGREKEYLDRKNNRPEEKERKKTRSELRRKGGRAVKENSIG